MWERGKCSYAILNSRRELLSIRLREKNSVARLLLLTPTVVAWVGFSAALICLFVCLFVCLSVFQHDISKINAARITKRDIEVFHYEWELHLFCGQKVKGQGHEAQRTLPAWVMALFECWLLLVIMSVIYISRVNFVLFAYFLNETVHR